MLQKIKSKVIAISKRTIGLILVLLISTAMVLPFALITIYSGIEKANRFFDYCITPAFTLLGIDD